MRREVVSEATLALALDASVPVRPEVAHERVLQAVGDDLVIHGTFADIPVTAAEALCEPPRANNLLLAAGLGRFG